MTSQWIVYSCLNIAGKNEPAYGALDASDTTVVCPRVTVAPTALSYRETDENNLLLPPVVIHDWDDDVTAAFKSTFDRLWNVFGYEGASNYKNGVWSPV